MDDNQGGGGLSDALRKMEDLLRKKELLRTGNAGVDQHGVVVDIRKNKNAMPVPRHSK